MIGWLNSDERGASAVLVAASLFLLMGFAALTIDWGAATNQRRQNQSAADFGVLAAAQFANVDAPPLECGAYSGVDLAACKAAVEVRAVVNANLNLSLTAADWVACTDTGFAAFPEFTAAQNGFASPITNCVRFSENMQRVRVLLPIIDVDTTFGQIMGRAVIETNAFAHSQADFKELSKVIPFALPADIASSSHNCLKTQGNLINWGDCQSPPSNTGNFGSMDLRLYGNVTVNTDTTCTGNANNMLLSNIARGVDHPLERQPDPLGTQKIDDVLCPIFNARANSSLAQPGVGSNLDAGLTYGGNGYSRDGSWYNGRLLDLSGTLVRNSGGPNPATILDDTPLWSHLLPGASAAICPGGTGSIDDTAEMQACLDGWTPADGIIFRATIKDEPRYSFVPEFHIPFGTPGTVYRFKDFRPVYLATTYYGCNATTCIIVHTPGVADTGPCGVNPTETCGTPGDWNHALQGVTAFILKPGMLPADALDPFPDDKDLIEYALIR